MAMTAWEIKNKFIYSLRRFTLEEIESYWKQYIHDTGNTDEYAFWKHLQRLMPDRFDLWPNT